MTTTPLTPGTRVRIAKAGHGLYWDENNRTSTLREGMLGTYIGRPGSFYQVRIDAYPDKTHWALTRTEFEVVLLPPDDHTELP